MSASIPPTPTYRDIAMALSFSSPRIRGASLAVRPPAELDPKEVQIVLDAARDKEAARRGGVDAKA
jgi:hypothetical protein